MTETSGSAAAGATARGTVAGRLDRLPIVGTHRRAVVAVGLGLFFDIYEVFLTPVLSTVLTKQFHLTTAQLTPVLASTFIGMFLGALVMGRLADKIGRRRAFLLNLGVYSLFSLLGAFSPNAVWLMVTRFIAGIGIGAELPLADTYLSDLMPARLRGRYSAWAYTVSFVGVPFVGFLAKGLAPITLFGIAGWRWIFVIGALGAVVVFALRRGLPESPRWLESVGRDAEADALTSALEDEARAAGAELADPPATPADAVTHHQEPASALLRPPWARRTLMMVVFNLFQTLGYYGFGTMVPLVLAAKGFAVSQSLLFTALTFIGYPVGSLLSLPLVERIERKFLIIGSSLGMLVFGLLFGFSGSMAPILAFGFLYTATSNVFSNAYHVYQAEIFPTALRSTAASGTYSVSRLASAVMPFVLIPVLHNAGVGPLFGIISAALVIVVLDIALLGPRTTGRTLESVNH
jgi:MFS transporter, putative metabolite:H+ symporter